MNILDLIKEESHHGYSVQNAEAKVCQDLILKPCLTLS